eukprot:gene4208-7545_t
MENNKIPKRKSINDSNRYGERSSVSSIRSVSSTGSDTREDEVDTEHFRLSQSFDEKPNNKVIEKWKNVNANMSKRLQSFNETLTDGEVALTSGINKALEKTTNSTRKIIKDIKDIEIIIPKNKKRLDSKYNSIIIHNTQKPLVIGYLYVSIHELENFEFYSDINNDYIYCSLLFEAQKILTSFQSDPFEWNETCRLNVTDENSTLYIELFLKSNNKFIGVISLNLRKFLKENMIDSNYPLIDELGSEIPNVRLHLSIQYSKLIKNDEIKKQQEEEEEEIKKDENNDISVKNDNISVQNNNINQNDNVNENDNIIQNDIDDIKEHNQNEQQNISLLYSTIDNERLNQIENDIIENQEELNKLKQLQFSTLSQLASSKVDTKLNTIELQFEELNGLIRQLSQENKELKLQVSETTEDVLFYKQKLMTLEDHIDFLRQQQGRKMIEWVYLFLSMIMYLVSRVVVFLGYLSRLMNLSKNINKFDEFENQLLKRQEVVQQLSKKFNYEAEKRFIPISQMKSEYESYIDNIEQEEKEEEEEEEIIIQNDNSDDEYLDVNGDDDTKDEQKKENLKKEVIQINQLKGLLSQTQNDIPSPLTVRSLDDYKKINEEKKNEQIENKKEEKDWFEKLMESNNFGGYDKLKKN